MSKYELEISLYELKQDKIIINQILLHQEGQQTKPIKLARVIDHLHLGNVKFRKNIKRMNKKQLNEKCKEILNGLEVGDYVCDPNDLEFLLSVFEGHQEWEGKQGCGIKGVFVDKTDFGGRCFWLDRFDGTITDISYIKSITPPTKLADINKACRTAIQPIIKEFRNKNVTFGETRCPFTNEILTYSNTHIDHYDLMFYELFKLWIDKYNIDEIYNVVNKSTDGDVNTRFTDYAIEQDFIKFHNANTHLRAVSKKANLSILK